MQDPILGASPAEQPQDDRLDSWKEIAAYLKRDVTTVQRWEKREGMPVHRHLHDKTGSIHASRAELDAWTRSRNLPPVQQNAPQPPANAVPSEPLALVADSQSQRRRPLVRLQFLVLPAIALAVFAAGLILWLQRTDHFWRNPVANAHFRTVTEFDGSEQSVAISRDGHIIAFLSDRDGPMDVWVTQVGSGEFHNLTHGKIQGLANPLIRALGFSPDGSLVTFWARNPGASGDPHIGVWAAPILGGEPRPYLQGVAEFDWSHDGSRLAYHTPGPGDPMFVSSGARLSGGKAIFSAPAGLHSHFPLWAPDEAFIYFVHGELPDKLDIWRIHPDGGIPERITSQAGSASYPVFLNKRTLLYLGSDADGSGPWLYGLDTGHRIPHRLAPGPDRYTSLAASADGQRVVATVANPRHTLYRLPLPSTKDASLPPVSLPAPISLTTGNGSSPRLGPDYLLYISTTDTGESLWKLAGGAATQLWSGQDARIFGGPSVAPDGRSIAFSVLQHGQALLYAVQADGTNAHIVAGSLNFQGDPAWAPDGKSITTATNDHGTPHLYRVPIDGSRPAPFLRDYSVDPVWAPGGRFVIYLGPDIGTALVAKAATADAAPYALPALHLTRGAGHLAFLPGGTQLLLLRGDLEYKNLWLVDLATGDERQLTNFPRDANIRDFDVSPDGHEIVLERTQERSDVVLLDLAGPK
jgi:Tol biopolymer transport system component